MNKKWFQETYRRHALDFHVNDWDERFLSEFNYKDICDNVISSKSTTAMIFANTHTGLCIYPTKVGEMHGRLNGVDMLKNMTDYYHSRGIAVIAYYCTIYTDWYWENYPECRIVDSSGKSEKVIINSKGLPRRFSVCCPNNQGYRNFVAAQLDEICTGYEFESMWLDMIFWPTVCYCPSCRDRYARETGREIPRVINWEDPEWVGFQRKRQEWLADFAHFARAKIKAIKPDITVVHQSGGYAGNWVHAPSIELTGETDWLSADLYRESKEMSFISKLFYSQSNNKPYEHINCWYYPDIHEHVVARSEDSLKATVFSALSNNGAFVFIDAIDPAGTVNGNNYLRAARVYGELEKYEKHAGGKYCQDIAIYYSFDSIIDMKANGKDIATICDRQSDKELLGSESHKNAAIGIAKTLLHEHLPFGVITRKNLDDLSNYQIIILPNLVMLGEDEADALRKYVADGGSIYASKYTSIVTKDGFRQKDFMLSDIFGVSFEGETEDIVTYVSPKRGREGLFPEFSQKYPVTLYDTQIMVVAKDDTEVLATVTLPYTDPKGSRYASILTDPPGNSTEYPSIVLNRYGKGKVIYTAGVMEIWEHESQKRVLSNLLKLLAARPFHFEADAPAPVEITLFDQEDNKRYIINLVNYQKEMPNIPVEGIWLKIRMDGRIPAKLVNIGNGTDIEYLFEDGFVKLTVPKLETYLMLSLHYR